MSIGQLAIILGGQLASVTKNAALRQTLFDKPFSGKQFARWLQLEKDKKNKKTNECQILLESVSKGYMETQLMAVEDVLGGFLSL